MKIDSKVIMIGAVAAGLFLLTRKRTSAGNVGTYDPGLPGVQPRTGYIIDKAGHLIDSSGNIVDDMGNILVSAGFLVDTAGNPIPPGYYQDSTGGIVRSMLG